MQPLRGSLLGPSYTVGTTPWLPTAFILIPSGECHARRNSIRWKANKQHPLPRGIDGLKSRCGKLHGPSPPGNVTPGATLSGGRQINNILYLAGLTGPNRDAVNCMDHPLRGMSRPAQLNLMKGNMLNIKTTNAWNGYSPCGGWEHDGNFGNVSS